MTTYTLSNGTAIFRHPDSEDVFGVNQSGNTLEIVVPDLTATFRYTVNPQPPGDTVDLELDAYDMRLNGARIGSINGIEPELSILTVDWTHNGATRQSTAISLSFENDPISGGGTFDGEYIFVLDGDPLPPIGSIGDWNAFENSIDFDSIGIPTGAYGPGIDIPLDGLGGSKSQNDRIVGTSGPDRVESGAGNDVINGLGGDDYLHGGKGRDILRGRAGDDLLVGGAGRDHLFGGAGNDRLAGGNGDDLLNPGDNTSYDELLAGRGNDTIDFSDLSTGYAGLQHFDLDRRIVVDIDAGANTGTIDKGSNGTTTIVNVKNPVEAGNDSGGLGLFGTSRADIFNLAFGANGGWMSVRGDGGNDTFNIGAGGSVRLDYGGAATGVRVNLKQGKTFEDGHGGTDTINGQVWELRASMLDDRVIGTDDRESVILMAGNDFADGRGGFDRVRYDRAGVDGVTVDLEAETAGGTWRGEAFTHTLKNFEEVRGSHGDDNLTGANGQKNRLDGRSGNDIIRGGNRNDQLNGEDGNDLLFGGKGNDIITGGNAADSLSGGAGKDTMHGGAGSDLLKGGKGADKLFGNNGEDRLEGGNGRDLLNGGARDDILLGGVGHDRLKGGKGKDMLNGGSGDDVMAGGGGDDTFVFSAGHDTILDFRTVDKIDLSDVAAITGFRDLKINHAQDVGGDLVIDDLAGNTLTLTGITEASLQKDDFIF